MKDTNKTVGKYRFVERKLMNEGQHSADSGLWEPWTGPGGRGLTLEEREA